MRPALEGYKKEFENILELCEAIDSHDLNLLQNLLLQDQYIQCLENYGDRLSILCAEPDFFSKFFDLDSLEEDVQQIMALWEEWGKM